MIGFILTRYLSKKSLQSVTSLFYILHFCKRLFETLFVHTFSHATMPIKNVFKNCIYYCGYGCLNGYINKDIIMNQLFQNNKESIILTCLFIGACTTETLNGYCHLYLRLLRRGKQGYQNPKSIWFKYCACPNYKFEILSWLQYSLFTRSWVAFAFCLTGAYQMNTWAEQKRKRLNTLYKDDYRKYKIFIGW